MLSKARKIFDDGGESLPGLIPARHLQQKYNSISYHHDGPTLFL